MFKFDIDDEVLVKENQLFNVEGTGTVTELYKDREGKWIEAKFPKRKVVLPEEIFKFACTEKTYISIILDKSGSMESVKKETIEGFNEQVQTITDEHDNNNEETYLSFVTFGSDVDVKYFNEHIDNLTELTEDDYEPEGMTSMLDAVGKTLTKYKEETDYKSNNNRYLVIIISDGNENNSDDYTYNDIAEMIQELEDKANFTFTYMGANQDLSEISDKMNIDMGNINGYVADEKGTSLAFDSASSSTQSYMRSSEKQVDTFYDNKTTEDN